MPEELPYRDGSRLCQPVKCVVFFDYSNPGKIIVKVIFTDDESETIGPKDTAAPEWLLEVAPNQIPEVIAKLENILATYGYQVSDRAIHPTNYHSFNLQPLPEALPET